MTLLGLEETRKTCPEAVFYGAESYLREDPTLNQQWFYHSVPETERLLSSVLSGQRSMMEPTVYMFMRQLGESALDFHAATGSDKRMREMYEKILEKANSAAPSQ